MSFIYLPSLFAIVFIKIGNGMHYKLNSIWFYFKKLPGLNKMLNQLAFYNVVQIKNALIKIDFVLFFIMKNQFLSQKMQYFDVLDFFIYLFIQKKILRLLQMDMVDVFQDSDNEQNHKSSSSDQNRDTLSTDIQRSNKHAHKNKNKKKYDPIEQSGTIYHYWDNPQEYRRIRKKVQNRLSSRRVRGRKTNAFEGLEQEVQYLRGLNSELHLSNARLQTQNKGLRQQLDFMKGLVKPDNSTMKSDPIDRYLSSQALTQNDNSFPSNNDCQSPFMEDSSDWLRLPNKKESSNSWAMLAVFTLILAVVVLPSDTNIQSPIILFVAKNNQDSKQMSKTSLQFITAFFLLVIDFLKAGLKYLVIFCYIWVLYVFGQKHIKSKRQKNLK